MNRARILVPLGLSVLLAGCAGSLPDVALKPPLLPSYRAANTAARPTDRAWWKNFGDPVLAGLVERALAGSPDVAAAAARIDQARAAAKAAGAARFPSGAVNGSAARAEQSIDSGIGRLTRFVPTLDRTQDQALLSASLGWDLDLAGGLRRSQQAALADAAAARAGLETARLAVAAEVTDNYLSYRAAQAQLAVAEARQKRLADRLHFADVRLRLQEASLRDRDGSAAALAAASSAAPLWRAQADAARFALAVLTGEPAGTALPELDGAGPIPLAGDPAAGVPADLLRARPDLVVAEAQVLAAHARVGAALGEYWPHVTLTGLIGFDTNTLSTFGAPTSRVTQGAVGLRWRLFDFARVDAEVRAARGREREVLENYRAAVLKAGAQVESGFALLAARRAALESEEARLAATSDSFGRAKAARRLGEISEDQLRGAELERIEAQASAFAARLALAQALLACHKALGG
ncbi:TolC family protein [Novosphingobium sp. Chol11]|uniref:TolC family protein n=1 Tax=Novosphingobium sp. Chol11 TaxID=1385763 RepID=UPI0025DA20B1|nr:TolC family protein [Novosphingobium sp. Chol11]